MSGLEVFAVIHLFTAVTSSIQFILNNGKSIYDGVVEIRQAERLVGQLRRFGIESERAKLALQMDMGRAICQNSQVDSRLKEILDEAFVHIQETMHHADVQLRKTRNIQTSAGLRWVPNKFHNSLTALEDRVRQLTLASERFSDILILVNPKDRHASVVLLTRDLFQMHNAAPEVVGEDVCIAGGQLAREISGVPPRTGQFLFESRHYSQKTRAVVEGDVRVLTEILAKSSRSQGILPTVGYIDMLESERFDIVFAFPDSATYRGSLRSLLHNQPAPSLNLRVDMCRQLADAVFHVHSLDFVHKNINSANIIVSTSQEAASPHVQPLIFLTNWRYVRRSSNATSRTGETLWWKRMYLHPSRQRELAQKEYSMGHDIYSLGVCMLEILLWISLVQGPASEETVAPLFLSIAESMHVTQHNKADLMDQGELSETELATSDAEAVQRVLMMLARRELPRVVGERLTGLVVSCLSCLENGFSDLSFRDSGGIETGLNFRACVTAVLDHINV